MHVTDAITEFYKAQGKHDRQLNRLTKKLICKWTEKDFAALQATRRARDTAVAALTDVQKFQHFYGLSRYEAEKRAAYQEREAA